MTAVPELVVPAMSVPGEAPSVFQLNVYKVFSAKGVFEGSNSKTVPHVRALLFWSRQHGAAVPLPSVAVHKFKFWLSGPPIIVVP